MQPGDDGSCGSRAVALRCCRASACAIALACSSPTSNGSVEPILGAEPVQLRITRPPSLNLSLSTDSSFGIISLTATDSTASIAWAPTTVRVLTSRGFDAKILVAPDYCLTDVDPANSFPFRFSWTSCRRIAVVTSSVLSVAQQSRLAELVSGRLESFRIFSSLQGAEYILLIPVGRAATAEAVRRAERFPSVTSAGSMSNEPLCVYDDRVPPPPCPEWTLTIKLLVSEATATGEGVPITAGGWIRVEYVDAEGVTSSIQVAVPQ